MKFNYAFIIGSIFSLYLTSCISETGTYHETTYIVESDSITTLIDKDSLITVNKFLKLKAGRDTLDINGNIFNIKSSVTSVDGTVSQTQLHYVLKNNRDEKIAEIRMFDRDNSQGFESITVSGDIRKISEEINNALSSINSFAANELMRLKTKGKLKVIDLASGEEIKK